MTAKVETRTREIQIITIYGPEYDNMRRKSSWCIAGSALCLFGGMFGIIPPLIKNEMVNFDTAGGILAFLGCGLAISCSTVFFGFKHHKLYRNLLLKNGWDPTYEHEIKLEYQSRLNK
jgi:hypothetical protein